MSTAVLDMFLVFFVFFFNINIMLFFKHEAKKNPYKLFAASFHIRFFCRL